MSKLEKNIGIYKSESKTRAGARGFSSRFAFHSSKAKDTISRTRSHSRETLITMFTQVKYAGMALNPLCYCEPLLLLLYEVSLNSLIPLQGKFLIFHCVDIESSGLAEGETLQ